MNLSPERMRRLPLSLAGLILISFALFGFSEKSAPTAVNGAIDVTGWRFAKDGPIKLAGAWQFFHNAFVTPEQVISGDLPQTRTLLQVPGPWSGFAEVKDGKPIPMNSYGTYLLKVTGWPDDAEKIALSLKVDSAYRTYVFAENETGEIRPVMEAGRIGRNIEEEIPQTATKTGAYQRHAGSKTQSYYIMVQVSNFHYREGYLWGDLALDKYERFTQQALWKLVEEGFILGMILIMAIYNFSLTLHRREDVAALWLGAFCLTMAIRLLSVGVCLSTFFPEPNETFYVWTRRLDYSAVVIGMPIFLEYLKASFFSESKRRMEWVAWAFAVPYTLLVLVTDVKLFSSTIVAAELFLAVSALYFLIRFTRALYQKKPAAVISAMGLLIAFAAAVNDFLVTLSVLSTPYLMHYGVVALLFSQGQVLAQMFARAFRTAEHLTRELKHEVEMQTREISSMLNHIPEGIFTIVPPGVIHPRYSDHLRLILGHDDIAHKSAADLIFNHTDLNADLKSRVETTIDSTLGEEEIAFTLNEGNLARSFQYTPPQGGETKAIECTWNPILGTDDTIEKMLVTVRDVTTLRALQNQTIKQQQELEYISEIIGIPADKFSQFIDTSLEFLEENQRLIEQNTTRSVEIIKIMFINMHTIKGTARTYQLTKMTGIVHEVEQTYSALLKDPSLPWDQQQLAADLRRIRDLIRLYDEINTQKLGRSHAAASKLTVERDVLEESVKSLSKIDLHLLTIDDQSRIAETVEVLNEICFDRANQVLPAMLKASEKVARDLGKHPPIIKYEDPGLLINYFGQKVLLDVFTHLIRNSMDHGIETAEERLQKNKIPAGTLTVTLEQRSDHVVISYFDDGRGLNLPALRKLGHKRGMLRADRAPRHEEIAEMIFASGLSTATSVSEISGRGVGMNAVRRFVENVGGFINLVLNPQQVEASAEFVTFKLEIGLPNRFFALSAKGGSGQVA
jgi:HPt (histidine-containing phosphotransfer) domain-containing protein